MNKYLVSTIIIFGIFIVFTLVIYNDIIELNNYSSEGSLIYEIDTGIMQAPSYFFSSVTTEIMNILSILVESIFGLLFLSFCLYLEELMVELLP
jgi:hypothetical protein